jgi:N-acetylmuramic acid 6-phosphate etherase
MVNIKKISTEQRNKNTMNIDIASTREILVMINNEDKIVPLAVEKVIDQIEKVVDIATKTVSEGGRVIYIGAGTSGRLGVLDASECPPTFGVSSNVFVGIIAGGDRALRISSESTEDSREVVIKDLKTFNLTKKDFLIGLAASGRTPYSVSAVEYANSLGCSTACITTSQNSPIAKVAKYPIEAITGAEPITGSTRMKSGTAQKLILNMISTATMIKLGKVYENLMIDVKMSNKKLVSRGIGFVMTVTDCDAKTASHYVEKYGSAKLAVYAIITKTEDKEAIKQILKDNKNSLRKALNR